MGCVDAALCASVETANQWTDSTAKEMISHLNMVNSHAKGVRLLGALSRSTLITSRHVSQLAWTFPPIPVLSHPLFGPEAPQTGPM